MMINKLTDAAPVVCVIEGDVSARSEITRFLNGAGIDTQAYESADQALKGERLTRSDCLLLDLESQGMKCEQLEQLVRDLGSEVPVIGMATGRTRGLKVIAAVKAGAVNFLLKPFDQDSLLSAIRPAIEFAVRRRTNAQWRADIQDRLNSLTDEEWQVLCMTQTGKPKKTIARSLGLSQRTVDFRRASTLDKMGVATVLELVQLLTKAGIAPPSVGDGQIARNGRGLSEQKLRSCAKSLVPPLKS